MPGRCLVAISVLGLALARPGLEPAREALYLYADSKAAETPKRDHQTAEGRQPPDNALIYSVSLSHAEPSCRCISGCEKSKEMSSVQVAAMGVLHWK